MIPSLVRRTCLLVLAASLLLLLHGAASAGELSYTAPSECPSRETVTERFRAAGDVRSARIRVRATPRGYVALVAWSDDTSRTLEATTCEGAVEGALLAASMRVDDAPATEPPPPVAITRAPDREPAEPRAPLADRDIAPPAERGPWGTSYGTSVHLTSFRDGDDSLMVAVGPSVDLERRRALGGVPWLRPSFTLTSASTFRHSTRSDPAIADVDVKLFVAFALDACPAAFDAGEKVRVTFRPCARTVFGGVDVDVTSRVGSRSFGSSTSRSALWWTVGGVAHVRLAFVGPRDHGVVPFVDVTGGVLFPLVRDRFAILDAPPIVADRALVTFGFSGGVTF